MFKTKEEKLVLCLVVQGSELESPIVVELGPRDDLLQERLQNAVKKLEGELPERHYASALWSDLHPQSVLQTQIGQVLQLIDPCAPPTTWFFPLKEHFSLQHLYRTKETFNIVFVGKPSNGNTTSVVLGFTETPRPDSLKKFLLNTYLGAEILGPKGISHLVDVLDLALKAPETLATFSYSGSFGDLQFGVGCVLPGERAVQFQNGLIVDLEKHPIVPYV